jgi:hypothetical protein
MGRILRLGSILDDSFRALLDGEIVIVGHNAWKLVVQSAHIAQDRLWIQLTAEAMSVWMLTLRLPADADRRSLLAAVMTFLENRESDCEAIVNAVEVPLEMRVDGDTTIH